MLLLLLPEHVNVCAHISMIMGHNVFSRGDKLGKDTPTSFTTTTITDPGSLRHPMVMISTHTRKGRRRRRHCRRLVVVKVLLVVVVIIIIIVRHEDLLHKRHSRLVPLLAPLLAPVDVDGLGKGRQDLVVLRRLGAEAAEGAQDVLGSAEGLARVAFRRVVGKEGEAQDQAGRENPCSMDS